MERVRQGLVLTDKQSPTVLRAVKGFSSTRG